MAGSNTSRNKREYYADSIYVEGNTVRRQQEAPGRKPVPQESPEELRQKRDRQKAADRNLARAMAMGRGYIAFLTMATIACFAVCLTVIHFQSSVSEHMSVISDMEAELSNQKSANDLAESRLETSMTLDEVKVRAQEMGLVYPSTSQIQYFTVESSDYMNQYTDVASR